MTNGQLTGERRVDIFDGINHGVGSEFASDGIAAGGAETGAQGGIGDELFAGGGECINIFRLSQEAGVVVDDFLGAIDIEADDGLGAEHGLRQYAGKTFAERAVHKDVAGVNGQRDLLRRQKAGEFEAAVKARKMNLVFENIGKHAIADKEPDTVLMFCGKTTGGFDDKVMTLEFKEAGDLDDYGCVGGDVILCAEGKDIIA